MHSLRTILAGVLLLTLAPLAPAAQNLLANGGMEGAKPGELPPNWQPLIIGAPATFTTDTAEKHGGQASVRIDAAEVARSYVRTANAIPVAPGEEIRASAWVKTKDVPPDQGTVIAIAEFADASGKGESVAKFNVADVKKAGQWQQISGSVKVPPLAASLHLRMGFSYARGTCWWDDVTVTAQRPLVCRIDLPEARLTPAMKTLPVTVLNRDGRKGPATVRATLNKQTSEARATLTGEPVQTVQVPIKVRKPGKADLTAALIEPGKAEPLFAEERKATVPPPLALGVPSPTHWVIEDGPPQVQAALDVAVSDQQREGATLELRIEGAPAGASLNVAPIATDGRMTPTLKLRQIPPGEYKLVAELRPRTGEPVRAEQPWRVIHRAQAKVTLNDAGYLIADGKPVFPLGIFNGGRFKEQAEAGFTVTHAYNAVRLEEDPRHADENAFHYLENTGTNGMHMLFMVPMKAVIKGDWDAVRRRIRMFRNHPALLAWDEEEGFARGDFHADTLKTLRKILQEEDPNHPFMVGDAKDVIGRIAKDRSDFFPVGDMDLGMWWWYPFPLRPAGAGAALEGDEGAPGSELVPPSFLVNAHVKQPLWVGIQSYKKKDGRFPTPAEYRAQAYLALISGAKGLMWYGGSVQGGIFVGDNPKEGHWEDLKKVASEVNALADVLMSPSAEPPTVSPTARVSVMLKHAPGCTVLVAVNRGADAAEVTLSSPQLKDGPAKVLNEQRAVTVSGGSLRDRFEPYGVHVYETAR